MLVSFLRSVLRESKRCKRNLNTCNSIKHVCIMADNIDMIYDTVMRLTKEAGKLINEKINNKNKKTEIKASEIDLVTETDQAVEKLLMDGLAKEFKDHKFIGEETVSAGGNIKLTDAPTWIIDPIDALFINQTPIIAIIYNPMLNQLFTARKGRGAFLNGNSIHVSDKKHLNEALLMFECGTSRETEKMKIVYENQKKIMPQVHGLRSLGSAALNMAMVASGYADAYFEFGIHIWDIAAGELIVKEAGGVVIDPSGGDLKRFSRRVLVASTQQLAEKLSRELIQFHPTPDDS